MFSREISLRNNHYFNYYNYIMLAYLMLFAALSNAVCLHNASFFCHLFLQMLFVFMLCLGLLTHSLFISCA